MQIIHFRTSQKYTHLISWENTKKRGKSGESSEISLYQEGEDSKDIVWKRSLGEDDIYKKDFFASSRIPVRTIAIRDASWWWEEEIYGSKKEWYQRFLESVESSIQYEWHISKGSDEIDDIKNLPGIYETKNIKHELIMIVISSLIVQDFDILEKYFHLWDTIILHMFSHREIYTSGSIYSGSRLTESYRDTFQKTCDTIQVKIEKSWGKYIRIDTSEDIVLSLNNFFKYRYALS